MKCLVCSKEKKDFEVWTNKIVIGALYDSVFQDHEIIRSMTSQSIICHDCMGKIQNEIDEARK